MSDRSRLKAGRFMLTHSSRECTESIMSWRGYMQPVMVRKVWVAIAAWSTAVGTCSVACSYLRDSGSRDYTKIIGEP